MTRGASSFLLALLLGTFTVKAQEIEKPRVTSMNLCADELVLRLADVEQVASVTWLAHDPLGSNVAELARGVGVNHGLAEEIVRDRPDLVIAGRYTTRTTVGFLRRLAIPVLELDVPQTLPETLRQIEAVAEALGQPERGVAMVEAMHARFSGDDRLADEQPRAFVLRPNGFTVTPGSLVDTILREAGLANGAADLDLQGYGQLPLEVLAAADADILIIDADERNAPALASEILAHPVIKRLGERMEIVALPSRLWTCAGPMIVEAVDLLRAAGERAQTRRGKT